MCSVATRGTERSHGHGHAGTHECTNVAARERLIRRRERHRDVADLHAAPPPEETGRCPPRVAAGYRGGLLTALTAIGAAAPRLERAWCARLGCTASIVSTNHIGFA